MPMMSAYASASVWSRCPCISFLVEVLSVNAIFRTLMRPFNLVLIDQETYLYFSINCLNYSVFVMIVFVLLTIEYFLVE